MFCRGDYLGCQSDLYALRSLNDSLNAKVVEQLNDTQELVMINSFAHENNEYVFRKSLEERLSDVTSWRWVLEDLSNRLQKAIEALKYEHNALTVVLQRIQTEIDQYSGEATKPGALRPLTDVVEEAIFEEYNYLRKQKKIFEKMSRDLVRQIYIVEKTGRRIQKDLENKQQAIAIDESCAKTNDFKGKTQRKGKKKKGSPLARWEHRCASLKKSGLCALSNALVTRQQVRGSRIQLTISAQAYATRVDAVLKRRLHTNKVNLDDLSWQREEATKDYNSLNEELLAVEENLVETLDQEQMILDRLAERYLRPTGERTKDDVDRKLRDELGRLRHFTKHLRNNINRIMTLKNHLTDVIEKIDCCMEDIAKVTRLDENRITLRLGGSEGTSDGGTSSTDYSTTPSPSRSGTIVYRSQAVTNELLEVIREEDEENYLSDE